MKLGKHIADGTAEDQVEFTPTGSEPGAISDDTLAASRMSENPDAMTQGVMMTVPAPATAGARIGS